MMMREINHMDSEDIVVSVYLKVWCYMQVNTPLPLQQISAGESMVWAVAMDKSAWFIYGIDQNRPQGKEWRRVPDRLLQVDVMDEYPTVCAVDKNAVVYIRPRNGF